ncbi:DUF4190 domain-containing protein [Ornithinibacillus bavariensis]|uniref:DUF4190 domain-containing protein n=1 Tax=Ornithinibacillus bavariensis TaxID=545502 RepID=A0A919X4A4_9BACI|nr:DUF4190 domain-containing protein [Ornithinibacillus bavariensis]GIO25611.1 hypothetical protein J43TS3_02220 [Ornithinibacillus bavariensis]
MEAPQETNGKAVAALVLGILSLVIPYIGFIFGIIGLVLANISVKEITLSGQSGRGLAIAGRVTSIICLSLYGVFLLLVLIFVVIFSFYY